MARRVFTSYQPWPRRLRSAKLANSNPSPIAITLTAAQNITVRHTEFQYSGSVNKAVKLSSPTKIVAVPNALVAVTASRIACPAGQMKKTIVRASCGATRRIGSSLPGKIVRLSIR